jgi:hypothetical protein
MGGWIFAQGRQAERTLSGGVDAGAAQIALANANTFFNSTELLFISEADGSGVEFLGAVTAVDDATVSFTLPLKQAKSSGAKLWKPITRFNLASEKFLPLTREIETGASVERSLAGVNYAIRTAQPFTRLTLQWEGLAPAHEEAFVAWLEAASQGGLIPFTIVYPARRIQAVRLDHGGYSRIEKPGESRTVKLPLRLEAAAEYW